MTEDQASVELHQGKEALERIIQEIDYDPSRINEAQTRFKYIDRLLKEALGWTYPNLEVEEDDEGGGRIDYTLGRNASAVLEAKRGSVDFDGLPKYKKVSIRPLRSFFEASRNFKASVTQCIQYCALKGAKIGIVCNGPQLAIFQAIVSDGSPLDGECYFFDGFDQQKENFPILWRMLSPEGIAENRAYREISLHRNPRIPPKASAVIPDYMRYRYRNDFQQNIRTVADLLLAELEENREIKRSFYRDCYVRVKANNRHLNLSKAVIESRYNRAAESNSPAPQLDLSNEGGGIVSNDALVNVGYSASPIVVLGDVGVGKTSFFENLYFEVSDSIGSSTIFIHINLGQKATLARDIRESIIEEVPRVLRRDYGINVLSESFIRTVHYRAIDDFDESPSGGLKDVDLKEYKRRRVEFFNSLTENASNHLLASLAHLRHGQNYQIIIVIDNADQRNFEAQQAAFLAAEELAKSSSALVFVALRPSTFFESKKRGALSGYQNRIFAIQPPPSDEVISKRLLLAIRVAEGKENAPGIERIRFQLDSLVSLIKATLRAVKDNKDISGFLNNISGGNVRSIVELISSFFGSPNVDARKIVEIEQQFGNYKVPLHEFTKHALLGEYAYYNPTSSLYASNIYDVSAASPREHFLKPILINYLISNTGKVDRDGFARGEHIFSELLMQGFVDEQITHALRKLARNRLIETPHSHFREIEVADGVSTSEFSYRATSAGIYHVANWMCTFSYLDAVSIDTPIFNERSREIIFSYAASLGIDDRVDKARAFLEYLTNQWLATELSPSYFDFLDVSRRHSISFEHVRKSLRKKRG